MTAIAEYFLNTSSSVASLDLFEITHPDFTQTHRFVRNDARGVTARIDGANTDFQYYPVSTTLLSVRDDLEASIQVNLGDVGTVLEPEINAVDRGFGYLTKPVLRYWNFRSDDLQTPLAGPYELEINEIDTTTDGSSFEAKARQLNARSTGSRYTLARFTPLRGFV